MHFLTHELLLFATAIWTTNIHDNIHAKVGRGGGQGGGGAGSRGQAWRRVRCWACPLPVQRAVMQGWHPLPHQQPTLPPSLLPPAPSPAPPPFPPAPAPPPLRQVAPVMGAGYHTIHHTRYNYNYGHYFTFVDRFFGTLLTPEEEEKQQLQRRAAAEAAAAKVGAAQKS